MVGLNCWPIPDEAVNRTISAYYCDHFVLPLPAGHRFPMEKYSRLRAACAPLVKAGKLNLVVPEAVTDADLLRVHAPEYVDAVISGTLDQRHQNRIGFPWSPQMVARSRRSVGGTLAAARSALTDRVGFNLAGGTHHAFADRGRGFCIFNDIAVAIRVLQAEGQIHSALVLDLDVHHGDGTAAIFKQDASVFTCSLFGERNYPAIKPSGDLDVALPDDCQDGEYLQALDGALAEIAGNCCPDLVFYLAGADPYRGDRLGRLGLSFAGLAQRDQRVFSWCQSRDLPVAVVMGGGYADDIDEIVRIHRTTIETGVTQAGAGAPDSGR